VIAIAEIKYVLKTTGENYKDKMGGIEKEELDHFVHEHAH
jgi:hypothetical protein